MVEPGTATDEDGSPPTDPLVTSQVYMVLVQRLHDHVIT